MDNLHNTLLLCAKLIIFVIRSEVDSELLAYFIEHNFRLIDRFTNKIFKDHWRFVILNKP